MRHRVAVPAFRQHADTDDAANVAAGWMQWTPQLLRQLLEALRIDRSALRIGWPMGLANGVENQPHPGIFVRLRVAGVCFMHHTCINADGDSAVFCIAQGWNV